MTSSQPFIQVQAITAFYHICLTYPEALKPGFPTLRTLLDDSNRSVVLATLNVLYEIFLANSQNFIQMVPTFFTMLESKSIDWILIRIIQILGILGTVEPRLEKVNSTIFRVN
jgi:hypothetical protein